MTIAEFVYTKILRPKPLRYVANLIIRASLPSVVTYGSARIAINPRDPVVSGALAWRVYEKGELAFFGKHCTVGMTVLDIGANVGLYSALAGHAAGQKGRVISFEPDPTNLEYLRKTIEINSLTNVTIVGKALSDHEGAMDLFVSDDNRGDNRLYDNDLATHKVTVPVTTLDITLQQLGVEQVDLIKMDVQGYEGVVFRGMGNTLNRLRRTIVMTEFWPDGLRQARTDPEQLLREWEAAGFELHELFGNHGETRRLVDKGSFIARFPGRQYTNIIAVKGIPEFGKSESGQGSR